MFNLRNLNPDIIRTGQKWHISQDGSEVKAL